MPAMTCKTDTVAIDFSLCSPRNTTISPHTKVLSPTAGERSM